MPRVAIIEDDEDIRELILYALTSAGFDYEGFENGQEFFERMSEQRAESGVGIDLLLLDIMLPGEDGISILKRIRRDSRSEKLPVIMLTAKSSEADKVKGLNAGADDYMAKPFGVTEMIARIEAVLRRTSSEPDKRSRLLYNDLILDTVKHSVAVLGESVSLTFTEFELLHYLLLNIDIVLSREKLMSAVWGYGFESESRTVDMHIKKLRQKLGAAGAYIKTVRNVGYKLGE